MRCKPGGFDVFEIFAGISTKAGKGKSPIFPKVKIFQDVLSKPLDINKSSRCCLLSYKTSRLKNRNQLLLCLPCRELTYPTLGKGTSSSKGPLKGDMLVTRRVSDENMRG